MRSVAEHLYTLVFFVGLELIFAVKKIAKILDMTVGDLFGENEQADLFKAPAMLKRFQDISTLPEQEKEKECQLNTVDHFIKASKISWI